MFKLPYKFIVVIINLSPQTFMKLDVILPRHIVLLRNVALFFSTIKDYNTGCNLFSMTLLAIYRQMVYFIPFLIERIIWCFSIS